MPGVDAENEVDRLEPEQRDQFDGALVRQRSPRLIAA